MRSFVQKIVFACFIAIIGTSVSGQNSGLTEQERDAQFQQDRQKQAAEFRKWKTEAQGIFTVYSPPVGLSKVITFIGDNTPNSQSNSEAIARLYAVAESACPGFGTAKIERSPTEDGGASIDHQTATNYCSLDTSRSIRGAIRNGQPFITYDGSPYVFVLLLNPNADPKPAIQEISPIRMSDFITSRLTPAINLDGTRQIQSWEMADTVSVEEAKSSRVGSANAKVSNTASADAGEATSNTTPADLKAAIDAIPRANRPIGLIYTEGAWDSYNMTVTFNPHMLFPNGITINPNCTAWNPMKPITKDTAMGCGFDTYRLEGDTAFIDSKSESINDYQGFKKGERVSVNFSNIGGLANNGLNPPGANATWGGDLAMSPSGKIQVGSWSGSTINGSG